VVVGRSEPTPVILRTLVIQLYIVACVVAIAVDYYVPALYFYLLAALLVWFAVGFYVYRLPAMNRPIFGTAGPPAPAPLPFGEPTPTAATLGFCAYCAAPFEPGTVACPACGRTVMHL
jgi:hypothetical protein